VADDTPVYLRNLTSEDAALRKNAVYNLNLSLLNWEMICSVTPAVVQVVAGILKDPILRRPLNDGTTIVRWTPFDGGATALVSLLQFLSEIGGGLGWREIPKPAPQPSTEELDKLARQIRGEDADKDEDWGANLIDTLTDQAALSLRAMAGEVLSAITPFVSDDDADVRQQAINAVARWGALQPDSTQSKTAADTIENRLEQCRDRDERAALVLSMGKFGRDVSRWLDDADEAVRACAALFIHTQHATSVLIDALTHPDRVNVWFTNRPAFFSMNARYALLDELVSRGVTIEEMLPAALALIAGTGDYTEADFEWGPILRVAFPDAKFKPGVRPPLPRRLTAAQLAVLKALVANKDLWKWSDGNASFARMEVGLPNSRVVVALMVGVSNALVPFYNWFCRATGLNGATPSSISVPPAPRAQSASVQASQTQPGSETSASAHLPKNGWLFASLILCAIAFAIALMLS